MNKNTVAIKCYCKITLLYNIYSPLTVVATVVKIGTGVVSLCRVVVSPVGAVVTPVGVVVSPVSVIDTPVCVVVSPVAVVPEKGDHYMYEVFLTLLYGVVVS